MINPHKKLLSYNRNNIEEEIFFGCVLVLDKNNNILYQSNKNIKNFKVCHRSCAKPMQLSVLFDLGFDNLFNDEQIAIMAASHQATDYHINLVKSVLKINDIDEKYLKCPRKLMLRNLLIKWGIWKYIRPNSRLRYASDNDWYHLTFLLSKYKENEDMQEIRCHKGVRNVE